MKLSPGHIGPEYPENLGCRVWGLGLGNAYSIIVYTLGAEGSNIYIYLYVHIFGPRHILYEPQSILPR